MTLLRCKQTLCNLSAIYVCIYMLMTGNFFKGIALEIILCTILCSLPDVTLNRIWNEKKKLFESELPGFIDLMKLAIDSGMNFQNAFTHVVEHSNMELTKLARKTLTSISYGQYENAALNKLEADLDIPSFTQFTNSIIRGKTLGVSLSKTLNIQSELIKTRRRQRAQELSRTASVKISIPLVFFIFPSLLIIYLGPGILRMLFG